jgi:hypothetical protein
VPQDTDPTTEQPKAYAFNKIPYLNDLLPKTAGLPGVIYAQVCTHHARRAQDEGWLRVVGTMVYTIQGPEGCADMELLARGKPIPGAGHLSGARQCLIDTEVYRLTGFPDPDAPTAGSEPAKADPAKPTTPTTSAPKPKAQTAAQAQGG